jgi:hypothetical protein
MRKLFLFYVLSFGMFQFLAAQVISLAGNGSASSPYLISNIEEFRFFRTQVNNKVPEFSTKAVNYKLISDLNFSNELALAVGKDEQSPFNGCFGGNNYTISGLKLIFNNSPVAAYAGLFGVCDGAVISNLNIVCSMDNSAITTINSCFVGGIASLIKNNAQIVNCKVSGAINNNLTIQNLSIGGVAGSMETGSFVKNCGTDISINSKSLLSNNISNVFLSAGGIVGVTDGTATVRPEVINCYAHGNIRIEGNYQAVSVGGIAGRNCPNTTNCIATGNMTGIATTGIVKVAGIAGVRGGLITNCVALSNELTAVGASTKVVSRITDASQTWGVISYCFANSNMMMMQGGNLATLSKFDHVATDKEMDKPGGKNINVSDAVNVLNRFAATSGFADKYIIINQTNFSEADVQAIVAKYGAQSNKRVAVGLGIIISVLNSAPATFLATLNNQLALAKKYDIPILVKFDTEYYWNYRPDLWNWWDPSIAGYSPDNKNNVEWSDWTSDSAIKICWLNWGRQIRKRPAPNLMSPAYINAWKVELTKGAQALKTWYDQLPDNKKYLLAGVVVGWESSIGANLFYIPNGNSYLTQPEANDPTIKRNMSVLPSRGVQATGYAAVKTAGIATSGILTEQMLTEVVRRNLENLSKTVFDLGFARNQIVTHCGGWAVGETLYSAANNAYSCPGWSFYGHAADPTKDVTAMEALAKSDAPYWAAIEWLLQGSTKTKADWVTALQKTLSKNTRLTCIYNWGHINDNINALDALVDMNISKNTNDSAANTIQNKKWKTYNEKILFDENSLTSSNEIFAEKNKWKIDYKNGVIRIDGDIPKNLFSIYDITGKLVWEGVIYNGQIQIELKNGVYLLENQKFIVK